VGLVFIDFGLIFESLMLPYILVAFLLGITFIQLYFRFAKRYEIVDKPNKRSSHLEPTLRGGGIIFPILFIVMNLVLFALDRNSVSLWFLFGLLLIGGISFWDDVKTLSPMIRVLFHMTSVGLMFWQTGLLELNILTIVVGFILVIGSINAYNFMDGINGITTLYSMVAVGTLYFLMPEMNLEYVLVALLIFAFYNIRKRAVCFSGDVGSVSLSYIIAFGICKLMVDTQNVKWILFLGVYGIDSVVTILYRLKRSENIFKPHRTHLYQYLANERGVSHVGVSTIYALAQLALNVVVIQYGFTMGLLAFGVLALVYLVVRVRLKLD
jgi:UDP-GlcNAc:undecaprenyl-phosphate/decaprenyl-phosphate GlcNAc-1-phosphate transferase